MDSFELTPRADERHLLADGEVWSVYEVLAPSSSDDNGPSLTFESRKVVRRVRGYPANWRTLGEEALFALSCAADACTSERKDRFTRG